MTFKIIQGDNRDVLKTIESNTIDAIVTDPPYGIDFLGKEWDANTGALETYQECLRVLKPGGHILAFSAARTYHHLAVTLEQAGFEIRDQIMWIYSSGFPKSQDVGRSIQRSLGVKETEINKWASASTHHNVLSESVDKKRKKDKNGTAVQVVPTDPEAQQWAGWGTALKPAHEPIALARKPLKQSIAKNVQEWGTGALNIDACRVGDDFMIIRHLKKDNGQAFTHHGDGKKNWDSYEDVGTVEGRFPSNVLGDIPLYQKYFYCPKVSRKERHMGFDDPGALFSGPRIESLANDPSNKLRAAEQQTAGAGNNHPTVKPVALMEYLIKLVTPPGGTVLDPFNGSGSTGMAAVGLGFDYIGIELDPAYVKIAETRIQAWLVRDTAENNFSELFEDATE